MNNGYLYYCQPNCIMHFVNEYVNLNGIKYTNG